MAQNAAFFAQLSHDANQVAAELIDTDEKLCEAEGRIQRLGEWITEIEGKQESDPNLIEVAKCQRLECEKSANAHSDRLNVLWQQLPRIEQSASSIHGYQIDQFPVMASIRNVAGRNQSHPISHLALELNRIADLAHREAERLWGPADSVKQLTCAATHCRNKAFNFVPNLRQKIEFIQGLEAQPERYKRPDEALQEARIVYEKWVQDYCGVTLRGAIADFHKALDCKPDPLKCIQDATRNWHGRNLMVERQAHLTACEAARSWCEIIRKTVYDLSISGLHKHWDHLKFLKQLVENLEGLAVADMSAEIDREEQATLMALATKEPGENGGFSGIGDSSNDIERRREQAKASEWDTKFWISATDLISAKVEGVSLDSLRAMRGRGDKTADGLFGRDDCGRIWRKEVKSDKAIYYLRSSLRSYKPAT